MAIDVAKVAAVTLKGKGHDASVKRLDSLASKEGIAVRALPYTTTQRHYDGTKEISYLFQVIVKRRSEAKSLEEISDIADILDQTFLTSENGSYEGGYCEVYTDPSELELNESGFYVQEVRFRVQITTRKE